MFNKILVALDGSKYSEIAAQTAYWMSEQLDSSVSGQHVLDPRLMDAFLAPEFATDVPMDTTIESAEKVYSSLRYVGDIVLDLFSQSAQKHGITSSTHLDEGDVVAEIVKRSADHDLVVTGHRGRGRARIPAGLITGSIAERIAVLSSKPVLIAIEQPQTITKFLVAYDGSEPSRGALLLGQYLSEHLKKELQAMVVVAPEHTVGEAKLVIEQAKPLLKDKWRQEMFVVEHGIPSDKLLQHTATGGAILILGAYGFRNPQANVLGSTTTSLVRRTSCGLLIYR